MYFFLSVAWQEKETNDSNSWLTIFQCRQCAPGCDFCTDLAPCLASYNWSFRYNFFDYYNNYMVNNFTCLVFRVGLLSISVFCVFFTLALIVYMYRHKKLKVFKVASPIFLAITLLGCGIMYLEVRITENKQFIGWLIIYNTNRSSFRNYRKSDNIHREKVISYTKLLSITY